MITLIILVLVAVISIAFLLHVTRGRALAIRSLEELDGRTQPVDLPAFRNLVDAAEEDFLRISLSAAEFRALQRARLRAALEYVRRIAHNATILLRLGEAVGESADPEIAVAARELAASALRLRLTAMLAMLVLYARIAVPGARIRLSRLVEIYQQSTERVVRLTRLQNPAYAARVAAVI
ncbi:MAG TPA: hypothetical protein VGQ71_01875 [Terriglobales bacterium]|jgi:hypothetical protein|nr:hypothetical protein [Terriglobales bacterium]